VTSHAYTLERVDADRAGRSIWRPVKEGRADALLEAIRRWADEYGAPPTVADWEPSRARRAGHEWRAARWEQGDWPSARMVRNHFGTMSAAIRAAGLVPRRSPSRTRRHLVSPDAVLEAIRSWNARYGTPPTMTDWDPARARSAGQNWRIARFYEGDWPSIATVRHHFTTLNLAVVAAGLQPRRPGRQACADDVARGGGGSEHPVAQQVLALRVRSVAAAARRDDRPGLVDALSDLAMAALNWADDLRQAGA
jgi:hypothetical protein